jgi:hypothetical protein
MESMMKTYAEEQEIALKNIRKGLATKVRFLLPDHACPACS